MTYINRFLLKDVTGNIVEITPYGELHTIEPVRISGGVFNDSVLDSSFFTATNANGGTATVTNTVLTVATNTTANGSSQVQTVQAARFVGGTSNRFYGRIYLGDTGTANNIREWGMRGPGATNGIYFKLNGTAALVGATANAGTETTYALALPAGFSVTSLHLYEIDYNSGIVYFVIDGQVVYTLTATAPYLGNIQLFPFISNVNSGGSTTNLSAFCVDLTAYRLGKVSSQAIYGTVTTAATYIFKRGPGKLRAIIVGTPTSSASTLTVYDNTSATGTPILVVNGPAQANPVTLSMGNDGVDLSTGLTVVSTGTWSAMFVFE